MKDDLFSLPDVVESAYKELVTEKDYKQYLKEKAEHQEFEKEKTHILKNFDKPAVFNSFESLLKHFPTLEEAAKLREAALQKKLTETMPGTWVPISSERLKEIMHLEQSILLSGTWPKTLTGETVSGKNSLPTVFVADRLSYLEAFDYRTIFDGSLNHSMERYHAFLYEGTCPKKGTPVHIAIADSLWTNNAAYVFVSEGKNDWEAAFIDNTKYRAANLEKTTRMYHTDSFKERMGTLLTKYGVAKR